MFHCMRRRTLVLLLFWLIHGTHGSLPAQDARDVAAGGMSIVEQCEALERRVAGQWEALEKLLNDWIAKEQPDLPTEWENLFTGLENLRRQSDLKASATGGDLSKEMQALRKRIADLNAKLTSISPDARGTAGEKVKQVEGRIAALENEVQTLGAACSGTRTKLDALKAEFEINIQLEGAATARETLQRKAGAVIAGIRPGGVPSAPVAPVKKPAIPKALRFPGNSSRPGGF